MRRRLVGGIPVHSLADLAAQAFTPNFHTFQKRSEHSRSGSASFYTQLSHFSKKVRTHQIWWPKPFHSQFSHYLSKGKYAGRPNFPCFITNVTGQQVGPSHLICVD